MSTYNSAEEEIRDSWKGTVVGVICILTILLAFRELVFSAAYYGDGGMVGKAIKFGVVIAFTVSLFLIKDAKGYDTMEKVRFHLFSLLYFIIFGLWIVPLTNRAFLPQQGAELRTAFVDRVAPGNNIRLGKRKGGGHDYLALYLNVSEIETTSANLLATNPKDLTKKVFNDDAPHSILKVANAKEADFQVGQTIQVNYFRGRWGQDFIAMP